MIAYQARANRDFWRDVTPGESFAGAMMAVGELGQLGLTAAIGALVGFACALVSVRRQPLRARLGGLGLVLNGGVLVTLGVLWARIAILNH